MSSVPGTNVPPVSFPGIASGVDYNSIITKLTSLTLQQNVSLNAQIATLNAQNTELIKINNLLNCVQGSLGALSNPAIFNAFSANSSNTTEGTASVSTGGTPLAGTYTITAQTQATATTITNNAAAGHSILDGNSQNLVLTSSYAAVTPTNGPGGFGTVTVDGVQVQYNVNVDSVSTVLSKIQTAVQASGDATFTASLNGSGQVVLNDTAHPITLGSPSDVGNILQVFKLTTAQINNTATSGNVTSTSNIGGINQATTFSNATTNAGYVTPVTSGFFTINGVAITLSNTGDNTASVIARINSSNAGVVASYDATTNKISLTATATGPQSIVVGASGDTSNFLTAAGLTTAAGATTQIGTQASVTVQGPSGVSNTVYSNSNHVTNAISGVQLNIGSFSSPYTVTVASDTSQAVNAVNSFISAYNAAISEIDSATLPPAVITPQPGSSSTPTSASLGGGVLFGTDISNVKDALTNLVSGFFGNATGSYNSLAAIGLNLTSSFSTLQVNNNNNSSSSSQGPVSAQTLQGTDGTFQALNVSKFAAALAANPSQVQQLFIGATSLTNGLGTYLGQVTGLPTLLQNGIIGTLRSGSTAIIQGFENLNTDSITSIGQQIKLVTDNANQQADQLRTEFVHTEATIAQYQSLQSQLSGFFKSAGG